MLLDSQFLVQLTQSPIITTRNVHAGEAVSLHGPVRRKRPELLLAVDGEGIQIYDVSLTFHCDSQVSRNREPSSELTPEKINRAKLITNYAMPFEETVTCPPLTVQLKKHGTDRCRYTYASLKHSKAKICVWEERQGRTVKLGQKLSTRSWQSASEEKPIIYLGTCSQPGTNEVSLLVVHNTGTTRLLSGDLSREHWAVNPRLGTEIVQSVSLLGISQGKAGLLHNREDIVERLEAVGVVDLLIMICNQLQTDEGSGLSSRLRVFAIHQERMTGLPSSQPGLEEIIELDLPGGLRGDTRFCLHKTSGSLVRHGHRTLTQFDLTSSTPSILYECTIDDNIESCVILSTATIAISTTRHVMVLNTKHGSVKALGPSTSGGDMTKSSLDQNDASVIILSHFPPLDALIALRNQELVAFQIQSNTRDDKPRKMLIQNSLAEALCRGIYIGTMKSKTPPLGAAPSALGRLVLPTGVDWGKEVKRQLQSATKNGDQSFFDDIISKILSQRDEQNIVLSLSLRNIEYLALSSMFRLAPGNKEHRESHRGLKIRIMPQKTVAWLLSRNALTQKHIERSLRHTGKLAASESLTPGAMVDAVYTFDPSLKMLLDVISSAAVCLTTDDIVRSINHTLHVLQYGHSLTSETNISAQSTKAATEELKDLSSNLQLPGNYLPPKPGVDKSHTAHTLMRLCLCDLVTHSVPAIRHAIRDLFPQVSLLLLIDYLRLELATGGWLSPYITSASIKVEGSAYRAENQYSAWAPDPNEHVSQPEDYVMTVSTLLSVAIDSIGATFWPANKKAGNDFANTIAHMKAEVSAALEGIEEAAYLQNVLHEVLLYTKHDPSPPARSIESLGERKREKSTVIAADGTEMIKPMTVGRGETEQHALPVGLKSVRTDKIVGDEVKYKSLRAIGHLKSMKVGAYSIERIMI